MEVLENREKRKREIETTLVNRWWEELCESEFSPEEVERVFLVKSRRELAEIQK